MDWGGVYVVGVLVGVAVVAILPDVAARLLRWALGGRD